ncbi:hypothetical protein EDB92DRAFT_1832589 [Lactarius akahatsu]|uniref:Bromo domain-containing protein n=1 Tax=Lactarius akahatsu TaxID=416441 RepID=A0AAD4QBV9_9AGAM|nr:hypothetical protein EDB92DRAFT_1832589 [Lactarius akahatsu]
MSDTGDADADAGKLNNLERLILAQAVYELGSNAWTAVSNILTQHPLINKRDDPAFSPTASPFLSLACQNIYDHLLESLGLDSAEPEKQPRNAHSNNLKLAQRMYQARVLELRQLILAEEMRFRSVAAEIEAIRAGKWDAQIEKRLEVGEYVTDKMALSQSERFDVPAESGLNLTHMSEPSPSVSQAQPHLEEETAQEQPDEDLVTPNSPPYPPASRSIHDDDIETLTVPRLSSPPSPVGIDDKREPSPSLELPTGETPQRHECAQSPQAPTSPSPSLRNPEPAASSEPELLDVGGPSENAEAEEAPDHLEHLEPSEIVEPSEFSDMEPDESAGAPTSHPLEDKISTIYNSPIPAKDDVSSQRSRSEPCEVIQSAGPPSPLEDGTGALAAGTPEIATHVSEPQEPPTEPSEVLEVKEEINLDDSQPVGTQLGQEDVMDVEVEQGDGLQAASPVTEQSRRDRKLRASHLHSILIVPDKRKVSEAASIFSDSIRDRKKVREDSQPVDEDEPGPVRRRGRPPAADSQTSKKFQTVIIMVHSQISQHRNGNIFHNPIKKSEAPDYYDIVKRPMDLKTIKARIREGQIASSAEFQRDVYLMFANSLMYNRPGSDIYTMAEEMMLESEAQINTFRQTEGIIKGSHR